MSYILYDTERRETETKNICDKRLLIDTKYAEIHDANHGVKHRRGRSCYKYLGQSSVYTQQRRGKRASAAGRVFQGTAGCTFHAISIS